MHLGFSTVLRRWLPLAAVATVICLLVYATVQHSIRSGANDPQVQLAEDAVRALEHGEPLDAAVAGRKVDIENSLAPFVITLDSSGQPLAGSGLYRGRLLVPPNGVLEFVRAHGEERVTLQPAPGVRIASVVMRTSARPVAFVLAGRSLREAERVEQYTRIAAALAWAIALAAALVLIILGELALQPGRHRAGHSSS